MNLYSLSQEVTLTEVRSQKSEVKLALYLSVSIYNCTQLCFDCCNNVGLRSDALGVDRSLPFFLVNIVFSFFSVFSYTAITVNSGSTRSFNLASMASFKVAVLLGQASQAPLRTTFTRSRSISYKSMSAPS